MASSARSGLFFAGLLSLNRSRSEHVGLGEEKVCSFPETYNDPKRLILTLVIG